MLTTWLQQELQALVISTIRSKYRYLCITYLKKREAVLLPEIKAGRQPVLQTYLYN